MKAKAFGLQDVRIESGPFKHAMDLNTAYLLQLEPDRLLSRFREYAGLTPKAPNYEGWEAMGISGHTLGHYLSGCALMYASTGNKELSGRIEYIVNELEVCQEAHGNGYISGIPRGKEIFEEVKAGDIRSQGFDLNGGWVPLYTMHKLFAGLRDAYRLAGIGKALNLEIKLGLWLEDVWSGLSDDQVQDVLRCEFGGMNEALTDLAEDTGDQRFLKLAERFYHGEVLNDLAGRRDTLSGRHANTQIPKIIGAARQFEVTGQEQYGQIARYFWERVINHHSYVIGGNSYNEHFGEAGKLNGRLGEGTCETCNTYNMLKLTKHMFQWDAAAAYADFYERAMFNHILASQQPVDGRVTYFVSLEMGGHKTFNSQFDSFTCCVGSGMESHSMYGAALYFHTEDALYINQYVPSTLTWKEKNIKISQQTVFPENGSGSLEIHTESTTRFALKLRCPYWAEKGMTVKVNGLPVDFEAKPSTYVTIEREWHTGDIVEYNIPMTLRIESMPDNPKRIAFLYGPLVLAGDLGPIGEPRDNESQMLSSVIIGERPVLTESILSQEEPHDAFRMHGMSLGEDRLLVPFYRMYDRRYTVYWDQFTQEEWVLAEAEYRVAIEANLELERRTVDFVQPAEMQPERDHSFEGEAVGLGSIYNRKYRDTWAGGWFSFKLKVLPDEPVYLAVTYLTNSEPLSGFELTADGQRLTGGRLESREMNKFETIVYDLPGQTTTGKNEVTVKFAAHEGCKVARVAGLRVVRNL